MSNGRQANQVFTLDSHLQNGPTQFVWLWIQGFPTG